MEKTQAVRFSSDVKRLMEMGMEVWTAVEKSLWGYPGTVISDSGFIFNDGSKVEIEKGKIIVS